MPEAPPETRAPRVALVNLGCAKNTVDSETALAELLEAGFELAVKPEEADLILINTCGFIESAREESLGVLREMLALKDDEGWPKVAAMGCLSQRLGKDLLETVPELDGVLGLGAYGHLSDLCQNVLGMEVSASRAKKWKLGKDTCKPQKNAPCAIPEGPRLLLTDASYAYLRVTEGCDNRCAYCAIPQIRGPLRSRPEPAILDEARLLCEEARVQELVLVGQDTAAFGMERDGESKLAELLRNLLKQTAASRIRILYAHPANLTDEVIELLAGEERLCRYLDLPLQHVEDPILKRMNRHYDRARVDELLSKLQSIPEMTLRTSLITGLPGEDEAAFASLLAFVKEGHFQHLGAFAYSPEEGTRAFHDADRVDAAEAEARRKAIFEAQQMIAFEWLDRRLGNETNVLIDYLSPEGLGIGRSVAEAPDVDGTIRIAGEKFYPGEIIRACLDQRDGYDLVASPVVWK